MRLRRQDLTARTSSEPPSHKFMRANDFMDLSALLRNFVTPNHLLLRRQWGKGPIARCAATTRAQNSEKRKECFAWRSETFRTAVVSHWNPYQR